MRTTGCLSAMQVCKLFCLFMSSIQNQEHSSLFYFYYWQVSIQHSHLLCLACRTHTADSVLVRCTLAFPTSHSNIYTSILCRWKMGEYPNVRAGFDINTSKNQYFTDKMATSFGPFYTSTLNPGSKTGLLLSYLGTVGVFPRFFSPPSGDVE